MTLSRIATANYLIIRMFTRGGVSVANNDSDASALEIELLPYVNLPVFILLFTSQVLVRKDTCFFTNSLKSIAESDFRAINITLYYNIIVCTLHRALPNFFPLSEKIFSRTLSEML